MSVHLVKGSDPILRSDAADALVRELLAGEDAGLAVEEHTIPGKATPGGGETEGSGADARAAVVHAVLNGVSTLPFMTERRVVVVREVGNLLKDDAAPLIAYFEDPTPTTELVLVAGGGTIAKSLDEAVKKHGTVHAPASEKAIDVLARELDAAGVQLRGAAAQELVAHVGGDAGLVPSIVETLAAAHGTGAELDVDDVTPYLGSEGSIPTWDLTNAVEKGDIPTALEVLRRLLTVTTPSQPKPMHPLQVLGMLHGHYRRLLTLDDPTITSNEAAAAALGGRGSPASAGFRLRQARALGTDGLRQAFDHLARADTDLKGRRAIPADVVLEVLVARLAALSARAGGGRSGGGRSGGGRGGSGRPGRGRAGARGR